jgi:flagellar hook-associated protein 1 FlgK
MSLFDVLGVGRSGLSAATTGLATTTHNVSNATTDGFTRRRVDLATADPIRRGKNWLGQGVQVVGIGRSADNLALGRLLSASSEAQAASTEHSALITFERMFEPSSGTSLRQAVDGLFDAFGAASADPSDMGLRRGVVHAASTLVTTVTGIADGLTQGIEQQDQRVVGSVEQINGDLAEVAALNEAIRAAGGPLSAGDLADQRDQVLGRLADSVGAVATFEKDGTATVRIADHAAVSGDFARTLAVRETPDGPPVLTLSVDDGWLQITGEVGGELRGNLDAREVLTSWLDELDVLATDLASSLNSQHMGGYTSSGAPGGQLLLLPTEGSPARGLRLSSVIEADPGALAFAGSPEALAGDGGNLQALLELEKADVVGGKPPGEFASALTGRVGSDVSLAATRAEAASATRSDAEELYANLTSVDLDEEAVRLMQYQAAYQAAAKVIQTTDEMLKALMQLGS